jgi:extradiol dioxygenase family protein
MDVEEQETRSYWGNCKGEAAGREGGEKVSIHLYIHTHTHAHTHTHTHTHTQTHIHTDMLLCMMDTQQPLRKLIPPPGLEPGSLG